MAVAAAGRIVLFGSGEVSPMARRVHAAALAGVARPIRARVLETPAGFEPNSAQVAARLADFLRLRLNSSPDELDVVVVPARKRGTTHSPDEPQVVAPLLQSSYTVLGPGSPTYAADQLAGSLAWHTVLACHRLGVPLALASAAAIAASAYTLPVYEIYKVGEELSWKRGLDLLGPFGRSVAIVPHWNNQDGGTDLDTSRCFMGQDRFDRLSQLLPPDVDVVGIDEQTALMLDFAAGQAVVFGRGGVTWSHRGAVLQLDRRTTIPLPDLGLVLRPAATDGIPLEVWEAACQAQSASHAEADEQDVPALVRDLLQARADARARNDWAQSDRLRDEIAAAGWRVRDTPAGPLVTAG